MARGLPELWADLPEASPALSQTSPSKNQATQTPNKGNRNSSGFHLELNTILGNTTGSTFGFDCSPDASSFATCAGSTAVVTHVDEHLNVSQKYFRAKPTALPVHKTPSYYEAPNVSSAPEPQNRVVSTLKGSVRSRRSTRSSLFDQAASPNNGFKRQRTRAITCLSLSADARLLAVGETGHNPRVMIFSTAYNNTDEPLVSLSEHAFAVRCLAFSPDGRWLCSVGECHDGFVLLWAINPKTGAAKLHSSNKCTSVIEDIAWVGNSVVTVGTRHVKVWRLEETPPPKSPSKIRSRLDNIEPGLPASPAPKTLSGRNCLLGSFIEETFTCITAISATKAIMGSSRGEICLLDDSTHIQGLQWITRLNFNVKCMSVNEVGQHSRLWVGGKGGQIKTFELRELLNPLRNVDLPSEAEKSSLPDIVAMGTLSAGLITVDANRELKIKNDSKTAEYVTDSTRTFPTHGSAVLGVATLPSTGYKSSEFYTWSADGVVIFWSAEGHCKRALKVPLELFSFSGDENDCNELKVVRASSDQDFFMSGDRSGVLRRLEGYDWNDHAPIKAHNGEINDIITTRDIRGCELVATCGRDRTIQFFREKGLGLDLLQTIDHHSSSVNQILFHDHGKLLLSSSSDRTIALHSLAFANDSMAYIVTRIINLKASAISMAISPSDSTTFIVSAMDKQIHKYEIGSGHLLHSTKIYDSECNEAVSLGNLITRDIEVSGSPARLVAGVSSTDKSIRIHDPDTGLTISKEHGHSEGISDVAILEHRVDRSGSPDYLLISTGLDGTIILWNLLHGAAVNADRTSSIASLQDASIVTPTLRRILSRSVLSEYQKSLEESGEISAPPTPTPVQNTHRIRRKPSKPILPLNTSKSANIGSQSKPETPTRRGFLTRSTTPPPSSPLTTRTPNRSPTRRRRASLSLTHRPKPISKLSTDSIPTNSKPLQLTLSDSADQVIRSLRTYRRTFLSYSSPTSDLSPQEKEKEKEVEREMSLTIQAMSQDGSQKQDLIEELLGQYSERLAKMVEERVNLRLGGDGGSGSPEKIKGEGDVEWEQVKVETENEADEDTGTETEMETEGRLEEERE